jgi:hypothetical protein
MQKFVFVCFAVVFSGFISCASAPVRSELESFQGGRDLASLRLSEFTILGRVEGEGAVFYDTRSGKITGDTYRYGFIDQDINTALGAVVRLSRTRKGYALDNNPADIARANANALMIDQAEALGADRIVYVTYSVTREASKGLKAETVSVAARGLAIKLLAEIPDLIVPEPAAEEPAVEVPAEKVPLVQLAVILEGDISQEKINEALVQVYSTHRSGLDLDGAEEYIVRQGDTLSAIIRDKYGELTDVGDAGVRNGFYFPLIMMASDQDIVDPDFIEPGMVLALPDLVKNLENPTARQAIKDTLEETAYIYNRKGDTNAENGLRTLAGSL